MTGRVDEGDRGFGHVWLRADGDGTTLQPECFIEEIAGAIAHYDIPIKCVLINSCMSQTVAERLFEQCSEQCSDESQVPCVIGWGSRVKSSVCILFAKYFYEKVMSDTQPDSTKLLHAYNRSCQFLQNEYKLGDPAVHADGVGLPCMYLPAVHGAQ